MPDLEPKGATAVRYRKPGGKDDRAELNSPNEISKSAVPKSMTARSTILAFAGCAVALVLLKWATSSPPKTYCHVDDPDNDIDITAWQPPDDPRPIPPGSWGSVLTTPAKLEKLRDAGKLPVLESGVPKVIHQTWPSRDTSGVAAHYRKWSASWGACHPDWLHVLWDDCDIRRLFAKHLPDFLPVYDAYPNPVQRADIFRCLVLKEYGGLYADMDYECTGGVDGPTGLNPPQDSPQGACKVFIVNSPDPEHDGVLQNAFMASVPEHPYWTAVFDLAVERRSTLSGRIWGEIPIQNTGPGLVSDAYTMLSEGEVKTAVCGLNNTEFSGQALGQAPNAIHRNAGSWCACRFPAINWACWKKCKEKKKTYVPSMYRDLTRYKRSIDKGEKLSDKDQATWDQYGHLFQSYYDKYGEFEDI